MKKKVVKDALELVIGDFDKVEDSYKSLERCYPSDDPEH